MQIPSWLQGSSAESTARNTANKPADYVQGYVAEAKSDAGRGLIAVAVAFAGLLAVNLWLTSR